MAFVRLLCVASKINSIYGKLKAEKENAIKISKKEVALYTFTQKIGHAGLNCRTKLWNCMRRMYFLRGTWIDRLFYKIRKNGSFENYFIKSMLGFIGGFLLTYILFLFMTFQLNMKITSATIICSILGSILTIGLAFSPKVRCVVFLTLPQFFSKKGRQAVIAYALILTITGPAKNTLLNMGILSESLACGQEQLKSAVRQIMDVIKKPFYAIRDAIRSVVKTVKKIVKKIKEILLKIKRVIMAILRVIKAAFMFLGKIINMCNKELGTPFQRCTRVFDNAISDCTAKLGPLFSWLCSITYLVRTVCYLVKPFDFVCMLIDFISDSIIGVVVRKIKNFIRHVKTMFYVRIKFSHSFKFQSNSSRSVAEVAAEMVKEVKTRTKVIMSFFDFMNFAATMFFLYIVCRVIYYRYKFLTSERFDNKYITKNFVDIDLKRAAMSKETVLPLNIRERRKYITIRSMRLADTEKTQLFNAIVLLLTIATKIGMHMLIDYSLYWIMSLIRHYGRFQSKVQTPNVPTLHIAGKGLLADLLKSIVKSFQPLGINMEIDTVPCLPNPIPPNYDRYIQIGTLLLICLVLTIFEPYGLRWRHWIMCYYKPTRAKERAVWLYNHILRSRSHFLKFARRQLRRKVMGDKSITKVTCLEYLRSRTNNPILVLCLGKSKQNACLLCGEVFRNSDKAKPIRCETPGCTGIYCEECFADLQNLCTVCMSPIEYGDNSDIDEERDSSDEEARRPQPVSDETSSESTEYSQGYQTDEKTESKQESSQIQIYTSSKDIEKQALPDYASMQSYDDERELYCVKYQSQDFMDRQVQVPSISRSKPCICDSRHFDIDAVYSEEEIELDKSSSLDTTFREKVPDDDEAKKACLCPYCPNRMRPFDKQTLLGESSTESEEVIKITDYENTPKTKEKQEHLITRKLTKTTKVDRGSSPNISTSSKSSSSDSGSFQIVSKPTAVEMESSSIDSPFKQQIVSKPTADEMESSSIDSPFKQQMQLFNQQTSKYDENNCISSSNSIEKVNRHIDFVGAYKTCKRRKCPRLRKSPEKQSLLHHTGSLDEGIQTDKQNIIQSTVYTETPRALVIGDQDTCPILKKNLGTTPLIDETLTGELIVSQNTASVGTLRQESPKICDRGTCTRSRKTTERQYFSVYKASLDVEAETEKPGTIQNVVGTEVLQHQDYKPCNRGSCPKRRKFSKQQHLLYHKASFDEEAQLDEPNIFRNTINTSTSPQEAHRRCNRDTCGRLGKVSEQLFSNYTVSMNKEAETKKHGIFQKNIGTAISKQTFHDTCNWNTCPAVRKTSELSPLNISAAVEERIQTRQTNILQKEKCNSSTCARIRETLDQQSLLHKEGTLIGETQTEEPNISQDTSPFITSRQPVYKTCYRRPWHRSRKTSQQHFLLEQTSSSDEKIRRSGMIQSNIPTKMSRQRGTENMKKRRRILKKWFSESSIQSELIYCDRYVQIPHLDLSFVHIGDRSVCSPQSNTKRKFNVNYKVISEKETYSSIPCSCRVGKAPSSEAVLGEISTFSDVRVRRSEDKLLNRVRTLLGKGRPVKKDSSELESLNSSVNKESTEESSHTSPIHEARNKSNVFTKSFPSGKTANSGAARIRAGGESNNFRAFGLSSTDSSISLFEKKNTCFQNCRQSYSSYEINIEVSKSITVSTTSMIDNFSNTPSYRESHNSSQIKRPVTEINKQRRAENLELDEESSSASSELSDSVCENILGIPKKHKLKQLKSKKSNVSDSEEEFFSTIMGKSTDQNQIRKSDSFEQRDNLAKNSDEGDTEPLCMCSHDDDDHNDKKQIHSTEKFIQPKPEQQCNCCSCENCQKDTDKTKENHESCRSRNILIHKGQNNATQTSHFSAKPCTHCKVEASTYVRESNENVDYAGSSHVRPRNSVCRCIENENHLIREYHIEEERCSCKHHRSSRACNKEQQISSRRIPPINRKSARCCCQEEQEIEQEAPLHERGFPYQCNREYLELMDELEEKLAARNKSRVQKAMAEFEKHSSRNRNLTRPIIHNDSSGDELLITHRGPCCPCEPERTSTINGGWKLNRITGEWYKVGCPRNSTNLLPREYHQQSERCHHCERCRYTPSSEKHNIDYLYRR